MGDLILLSNFSRPLRLIELSNATQMASRTLAENSPCFQVFPYCRKKGGSPGLFDVHKRLAIDAGCASIPLGRTVSLFEGLDLRDMHEETPEAMQLIRLRLPIYPSPQILQIDRWFYHFTPASRCRTEYSPVRALPSGRVLLHVHRQ